MKKNKPDPLTLAVVKRLVRAGLTDRQVAVVTGHTKNHAKCYRQKYGLKCNPERREVKLDPNTVRVLVGEGWSGVRIAKVFCTHKTSVYSLMRKHRIKTTHHQGRPRKRGGK